MAKKTQKKSPKFIASFDEMIETARRIGRVIKDVGVDVAKDPLGVLGVMDEIEKSKLPKKAKKAASAASTLAPLVPGIGVVGSVGKGAKAASSLKKSLPKGTVKKLGRAAEKAPKSVSKGIITGRALRKGDVVGGMRIVSAQSSHPIHFGTHEKAGVYDITEKGARAAGFNDMDEAAKYLRDKGFVVAVRRTGQRNIKSNHLHFADPKLNQSEAKRLLNQRGVYSPVEVTRKVSKAEVAKKPVKEYLKKPVPSEVKFKREDISAKYQNYPDKPTAIKKISESLKSGEFDDFVARDTPQGISVGHLSHLPQETKKDFPDIASLLSGIKSMGKDAWKPDEITRLPDEYLPQVGSKIDELIKSAGSFHLGLPKPLTPLKKLLSSEPQKVLDKQITHIYTDEEMALKGIDWYDKLGFDNYVTRRLPDGKYQITYSRFLPNVASTPVTGEVEHASTLLDRGALGTRIWSGIPVRQGELFEAPKRTSLLDMALDIISTPKTMKSTADISAPGRQGLGLIGEKSWWKSWKPMLKALTSEDSYRQVETEITSNPNYGMARAFGLALTELDGPISQAEEAFMGRFIQKVPVMGKVIRASNRAYNTFLNKLRMDTWDKYVNLWGTTGSKQDFMELAKFINAASGRSNMGQWENVATTLNAGIFSPRFVVSRVQYPAMAFSKSPRVRKLAAKNLAAYAGVVVSSLALLKMSGADVETDPTSPDFGKAKIGKIRLDLSAGEAPMVRYIAQFMTGRKKDPQTKEVREILREDVLKNFLRSKLSPAAGMAADVARGKRYYGGEKMEYDAKGLAKIAYEEFSPLVAQDIVDAIQSEGVKGGFIAAPTSSVGIGVSVFDRNPSDVVWENEYLGPELDRLKYYPDNPEKVLDVGEKTLTLSDDEYKVYLQEMWQATFEAVYDTMDSDLYAGADDLTKVESLKDAVELARGGIRDQWKLSKGWEGPRKSTKRKGYGSSYGGYTKTFGKGYAK